jgi:cell division protein FtsI (penicillin-binding protein 3)
VVDPVRGPTLELQPVVVRRAASAAAAAQLTRWMEGVITDPDGTGKRARLDGWRAAGKTGTAQKADPVSGGYSADRHVSSFVGFAPAEAPRIVIGVFIDEPRGEIYGGEVAAPVFKEVAEQALRAMGVPEGDGTRRPAEAVVLASAPPEDDAVPTVEEALRSAGAPRPGGVAVPALEGMPARSAIKVLEAVELLGETAGSGLVSRQSPPAGTVVEPGSRVRLVLAPRG